MELVRASPGAGTRVPRHRPRQRCAITTREREVLELLAGGHRVPHIAKRLSRSPHTVRGHLKALFRKLDVHSQAELIDKLRS
jgi:DNA-binding NarL/FixJ family response regulator